ncbi:hypothetical protein BGY98DRAFT_936689 [Russula aff. rugulosa BPL654]|nr:hypothetical protein BGY98DRAFT_936689 [Russula aff. rugulosa BPL654]
MSHTNPTSSSSSNFQLIFDDALKAYEKRTRKDLRTHPLAAQLQNCNSPSSILDVLQQQVQELNQSQRRNERWTRWLDPTVTVLHVFSENLGKSVTSAFPPAKAIFTAFGVLLSAAKNVRASEGALFVYSSAWKRFSDDWRFTLKRHWTKKCWIRRENND